MRHEKYALCKSAHFLIKNSIPEVGDKEVSPKIGCPVSTLLLLERKTASGSCPGQHFLNGKI